MILAVLLSTVLTVVTSMNYCYTDTSVMHTFTVNGQDTMSDVAEKDKSWQTSAVKMCPENTVCYQYNVAVTADVKESTTATTTYPGVMTFTSQGCFEAGFESDAANTAQLCTTWKEEMIKIMNEDPATSGLFSNLNNQCSQFDACGANCVSEADIEAYKEKHEYNAATGVQTLSATLLLALSYLLY